MKILCLRLSNLASIAGEHCIDFESQPLANAGLIAITGKTGAGKSTLLDAMCLALFDQIPRLNGALGSLTDVSGQDISIKDTKHILRRGAISGFSEVEFIALDQKRYRARWDIRRSYKKLNGNLKVDRAVTCLEDNRVLTQKISECNPCIQSLIGLSFEQFTRAVLLAQSEVGAFLKAKDHERAALLEYLTNSNIFSLISQRAFEKTKEIKVELDKKQEFSQHIQLLSIEEVQIFEKNKHELDYEIKAIQLKQQQLEYAKQWYMEQTRLENKINEQEQNLEKVKVEKSQVAKYKKQLQHLSEFSEIQNTYQEVIKAKQQQEQSRQHYTDYKQQFQQTQQRFLEQETLVRKYEEDISNYENQLQQLQPELQKGFELDAKREHYLIQYQNIKNELHEKTKLRTQHEEALNHISIQENNLISQQKQFELDIEKYQFLSKLAEEPKANIDKLHEIERLGQDIYRQQSESFDIVQFKQSYETRQRNIEQTIKTYGNLDQLETNYQQHQAVYDTQKSQKQLAEQLYQHLKHYNEKKQQIKQQEDDIKQQENILLAEQEIVQKNHETFTNAEQELTALQKIINEQKLIQSEHITRLRAALTTDNPCPVCGSKAHPYIEQKSLLEDAINSIHQQQEEEARQRKDYAFTQWQTSQQHYLRLENTVHHLRNDMIKANNDQIEHWNQIEELFKKLTLEFSLEQSYTVLEYEINILESTLSHLSITLQAEEQILISFKQELKQQNQEANIIYQIEQFEKLVQFIDRHLLTDNEKTQWKQAPLDCINRYILSIEQLHHTQQNYQQCMQSIDTLVHKKQLLAHQQTTTHTECTALEQKLLGTKQQGLDIRDQINQLIERHSTTTFATIKDWQTYLYDHKNQLNAQYRNIKNQFSEIEHLYHTQQHELTSLKQNLEMWQTYEQEQREKQIRWQQAHPVFDDALIDYCLKTMPTEIQELRQHIQDIQQQHIRYETEYDQTKQSYVIHQQKKPSNEFHRLDEYLRENEEIIRTLSHSRDEINAKLMSNAQAIAQQKHYAKDIEELQQQVNRWGKISELIGSKDGAKFRRIAQEHHLDILIEYANQQLQPLSARYELKRIQHSLGLAIIDHEMNSEVRPVLSLSGGETFLVSLALALAIANMASGAMRLESLFIDEGFGTLDPSSLHIVMDALDRLQSQGRKVILISHVQEMHERIPVQVQVKSVGSGTSQIEIIG